MRSIVTLTLVFWCSSHGIFCAYAQKPNGATHPPIAEIRSSTFSEDGGIATIQSFDLSSDGSRVALLYQKNTGLTGPRNQSTWAAVWDISEKRIIGRTKLSDYNLVEPTHGVDPAGPIYNENYVFLLKLRTDIIFSPDKKHAVAMAYGRVWILDGVNCSMGRSLEQPRLGLSAPVEVQALSSSVFAVTYAYGLYQYQVELYNFATGNKIAAWSASAIPDSFSADGKLAVAPDPAVVNDGGVTNVQILDAHTGKKLKSIAVGFHFGKSWLGFGSVAAHGSVLCHFLSETRIVVMPTGQRDSAGHHSGNSMEIMDITEGRIVGELRPKRFGPTSVLVESPDRSHFAVLSIYAAAWWFSIESNNPAHFTDELMIFANDGRMPERILPWSSIGAETDDPPRISADGSMVAVLVEGGVQVFRVAR